MRQADDGQRNLACEFTTSDRLVLVGTGPAMAGKTTALALAARATEQAGSRMIGLAPSAAAADVFKDAVGVEANTIHAFLKVYELHGDATPESEHPAGMKLRAGDVVVVDEAGMAGTRNLARVVDIAEAHGAHVRLIGDSRQLDSVESGGALRLLERGVGSVQLDTIHRFRNVDGTVNQAEADASERLRDPATTGDPFAWYVNEGRVVGGDVDRMTGEVFAAWQADTSAGNRSVMKQRPVDRRQGEPRRLPLGHPRGPRRPHHPADGVCPRARRAGLRVDRAPRAGPHSGHVPRPRGRVDVAVPRVRRHDPRQRVQPAVRRGRRRPARVRRPRPDRRQLGGRDERQRDSAPSRLAWTTW